MQKRQPQILIIIDIMTLLVFMYITSPHSINTNKVISDTSKGFIDGTKFYIRNNNNETLVAFEKKIGVIQPSESNKGTGNFVGIKCSKNSKCANNINLSYEGDYDYIGIYPPDSIMQKAYGFFFYKCTEVNCNGNIYIDYGTGEAYICSQNDGYFKYMDSVTNTMENYTSCSKYLN